MRGLTAYSNSLPNTDEGTLTAFVLATENRYPEQRPETYPSSAESEDSRPQRILSY